MSKKLKELQSIPNFDDPNVYWATFDLGVSSALVCKNFELVHLKKDNPKKVQFVFQRKNDIEKVVADYWANKLAVNAREFFDNIKMLKNRIYSE